MPKIGLVSCTKTKLEDPAPPGELYTPSMLFSKASQYCDQEYDDWYILSAKHHLLEPDGPSVEPYDDTLTGVRVSRKQEWAKEAFEQLESARLLESDTVLVFHAGKVYSEEIVLRDLLIEFVERCCPRD